MIYFNTSFNIGKKREGERLVHYAGGNGPTGILSLHFAVYYLVLKRLMEIINIFLILIIFDTLNSI